MKEGSVSTRSKTRYMRIDIEATRTHRKIYINNQKIVKVNNSLDFTYTLKKI